MRVLVFGATGRVGSEIVKQATAARHDVTVFARRPEMVPSTISPAANVTGNVLDGAAVTLAMTSRPFEAVVSAIGAGALEPSTLVTEGTRSIVNAMRATGLTRYLAVSGTAEMSRQTTLGRVTNSVFRRTPVGHAIRDHDGAFALVAASELDWTLAGCPYIRDGPAKGAYRTELVYPGGFKIIHPADVAAFIVRELVDHRYPRQIIGLWY
jgi:uncharacterized protein